MRIFTGFFRSLVGQFFILVAVATGFLGAGRLAYDAVAYHIGETQVGDLADQMLRRSELAADYAVITLSELATSGFTNCDPDSLSQVRQKIYSQGTVKDIAVLGAGGEMLCSGMSELFGFGISGVNLQRSFPASNGSISFHDLGREASGVIGISWKLGDRSLLVVLNLDLVVFDALPGNLRDRSDAILSLGDNLAFAKRLSMSKANSAQSLTEFVRRSDRYPLVARLVVPDELLASHFRPFETELLSAWGLVGLAIGFLLSRLVARPPDPSAELRRALDADEFKPFMQPIFSLKDQRIVGCEVLMRWVKADGSITQPARFIPLAEESGLIVPMTRAIIRSALDELAPLLLAEPNFTAAFNIVPADLCAPGFVREINELVDSSAARRNQVVLELTERQGLDEPKIARSAITELRELGYVTALDDTGTGHNGLSYVQDLGVDIIKIDKTFVDALIGGDGTTHIVELLVGLARRMGMTTVAEGVETREQALALKALGVDKAQGYLLSPPLDAAAFRVFLETRRGSQTISGTSNVIRVFG